ncbi:MAG TPA: PASTA domain-containing protein [Polyangiaceae bacterium]|nr:PASTA domain-containing protein [Polyangiaceae bacterium]
MATIPKDLLDVLSVPVGDLVASVGRGIADAQREMDAASIAALREVYESNEGFARELQRIGYRPTWYHIPEAESEIQVALTVSGEASSSGGVPSKIRLYAAPVDAGYAARFNYSMQASSRLKFRVVPVPPSNVAEALQVMPSLVGLSLGEARARLALLNIAAALPEGASSAVVTTQTPAAGTLLARDENVSVGTA